MENIEYLPHEIRNAILLLAEVKNKKTITDGRLSVEFSEDMIKACNIGEYALVKILLEHVHKFPVDDEIKEDFMIPRIADIEREPIVFLKVPDGEGNEFKLPGG